jgi:hypothetical protein
MSTPRDNHPRPLQSAQCSLCGIALPIGLMVPDGGRACADIRWYCRDTMSCTERWTARLPRTGYVAPTSRDMSAGGGELRSGAAQPRSGGLPDPVPAELLGGAAEEA